MNREQEYYDTLKNIAAYSSPEWIRAHEKQALGMWGVSGDEAIEMAYENVLAEAQDAIKGRRRPR